MFGGAKVEEQRKEAEANVRETRELLEAAPRSREDKGMNTVGRSPSPPLQVNDLILLDLVTQEHYLRR